MSSSDEIAKAKAKINKLLNMTVQNGCSEDEQETAMAMAAGIATRLGIDLEAARQKEATPAQRKAVRKGFNQEFKIHQVLAFQAAGQLYGCEVYTYSGGWNWRAIIATLIGCGLAWIGLVIPALAPLYAYAWFVGFGSAGITHYLLMKTMAPKASE